MIHVIKRFHDDESKKPDSDSSALLSLFSIRSSLSLTLVSSKEERIKIYHLVA